MQTIDLPTFIGVSVAALTLVGGFFTFIVNLMIKSQLSNFLDKLNGRYVYKVLWEESKESIENRLEDLEVYVSKRQ